MIHFALSVFTLLIFSTVCLADDGKCTWNDNSFFKKTKLADAVQAVFQYYYPGFELQKAELDYISRRPLRVSYLIESRSLGYSLTKKWCGESEDDDESDAFRHFVASAFLASKIGHAEAVLYLAGHEQFDDMINPTPRELMDLHNNDQGAKFGDHLRREGKTSLQDDSVGLIVREALRKLRLGRLKVIRSGESRCAHPEAISQELDQKSQGKIDRAGKESDTDSPTGKN